MILEIVGIGYNGTNRRQVIGFDALLVITQIKV